MKKELNFDIKRMLSLIEGDLGNVKPIIVEDYHNINDGDMLEEYEDTNELNEEDINRLEQLAKAELDFTKSGCQASGAVGGKAKWSNMNAETIDLIVTQDGTKIGKQQSYIKPGQTYAWVKCDNGDFMVTDIIGDNPNKLIVLKYKEDKDGNQSYVLGQKEFKGLISRLESVTSDETNLTADQSARVKQIIGDSGVSETGYSWIVDRPDGTEGVDYVPVDLATGIAKINGKDVQIIKKLALDGLDPEFKTPGKYYAWARIGTSVKSIDIPEWLEGQLTSMGYTKNMPTDEIQQGAGTTLEAMCDRTGRCTEQMRQYIVTNPNARIWPLDVSADEFKKKQCRGIVNTLAACGRAYDKYNRLGNTSRGDAECQKAINALGSDYAGISSYNGKILKLKNDYTVCSDQKLGALAGRAKDAARYLAGLGKSGNPFSPVYSAQEAANMATKKEDTKKGAMMEESISKSIRKVLKEHTKPNSDYMIKKSVRNNLRRFL